MAAQPDVLVVGGGFAGMYAVHRFRELGLSVKALEAGSDVGGTWYWNRYPGARCDVPSLEYSYGFSPELEQEWDWPEVFSAQEDILRYANHVADKFDLRRDMQFNTRIVGVEWLDATRRWRLTSEAGETFEAPFCVMATGCLSVPVEPKIPGAERFRGEIYHTGRWPHEHVDLGGKRVGVIGTGSSGVQAIPELARQSAHLTVFQRTRGVHGAREPQTDARCGATGIPRQLSADPRDAAEERRRYLELPPAQEQATERQHERRRYGAHRHRFIERRSRAEQAARPDDRTAPRSDGPFRPQRPARISRRLHERGSERDRECAVPRHRAQHGARSRNRRTPAAEDVRPRLQTPGARPRLLRHVQSRQRDAGRSRRNADRDDHRDPAFARTTRTTNSTC